MATFVHYRYSEAIHPIHTVFTVGTLPLFLGALLADIAYGRSFEIQWSNFASWLIVGGLIFVTIALLFAIADVFRAHRRARGFGLYFLSLLVAWGLGVFNALIHARDAWAIMPEAIVVSAAATLAACVSAWLAVPAPRMTVMKRETSHGLER
ncbi:MAG: hypothetical protein GX772_02955 [Alcaligenaceae bacterium]|nr:hypothetical protein [Alcaligenaceae bacterium]